jgi:23S rRNA (guanine2535-N1)-methyltransferase
MPYQFTTEDQDHTDFSSGRVIYNLPGAPAFPVRLAEEIFQRAQAILSTRRRLAIYDPTCGAAYHLAVLGFTHGGAIESITASDIDENALAVAQKNLGLLSPEGLEHRRIELESLLDQYGKSSHAGALASLERLKERLANVGHTIPVRTFQANALEAQPVLAGLQGQPVDLVISDIPYGHLSAWQPAGIDSPVWSMLDALTTAVPQHALVAIAADKHQKPAHPAYRRASQFQIGKRRVTFLQRI